MKTIKLTDKSTNEQCSPIVSDTTIQCQKKEHNARQNNKYIRLFC